MQANYSIQDLVPHRQEELRAEAAEHRLAMEARAAASVGRRSPVDRRSWFARAREALAGLPAPAPHHGEARKRGVRPA